MTVSTVKSLRIEKGYYRTQKGQCAVVRAIPDQETLFKRTRMIELEGEIQRLNQEIAQAALDAEAGADAAYQKGFSEGQQAGYSESRNEVEPAIELLKNLAVEIENGMDSVWSSCRQRVIELALEIAEKIIGEAAQSCREIAVELTNRCLKMIREQAKVSISVNPDDAEAIRVVRSDLIAMTEGLRTVEVFEKGLIPHGGVIVETDAGQLDARIEEQMEVITAVLKPKWSHPDIENHTNEE